MQAWPVKQRITILRDDAEKQGAGLHPVRSSPKVRGGGTNTGLEGGLGGCAASQVSVNDLSRPLSEHGPANSPPPPCLPAPLVQAAPTLQPRPASPAKRAQPLTAKVVDIDVEAHQVGWYVV